MSFSLMQADKDLFAVYQTIYSNADIEMWYDWDRRLNDTKWTDQCYFLLLDGQKVGGVVLTDERIMFPFLIPPFCDRVKFWSFLLKQSPRDRIYGVLEEDTRILQMFDYRVLATNQVMCRPADVLERMLPEGFLCRRFDINKESDAIGTVLLRSYEGGICNEINGVPTLASVEEDAKNVLQIYSQHDFSQVIVEKTTNRIAAVCLAGIGENYTHHYAEIADLCVLPPYRGLGLAEYLVSSVVTDASGIAPFVKLFVYVGNSAEYLYHKLGFLAGLQFANMSKRK